jgi:hypothetical protein
MTQDQPHSDGACRSKKLDPTTLAQFTGTEHYYRLNRKCLITDGAKYLADAASAYWLLEVAASYLLELGTADWFVLVRLRVKDCTAELTVEDGNGIVRATQQIPFTDFPADEHSRFFKNVLKDELSACPPSA